MNSIDEWNAQLRVKQVSESSEVDEVANLTPLSSSPLTEMDYAFGEGDEEVEKGMDEGTPGSAGLTA